MVLQSLNKNPPQKLRGVFISKRLKIIAVSPEEGKIIHVGIVLDDNKIIHAAGKVRIDKFDHYGIFNVDTKKYSHHLQVIKKIV